MHLPENTVDVIVLTGGYLEHKITLGREDGKFVEGKTRFRFGHKIRRKYTKVSGLVAVCRYIPVGDFGRCEQYCMVFDVQYLVRVLDMIFPLDKAYLIICPSVVGHRGLSPSITIHVSNVEHIEMPDVACALVFQEAIEFRAQGAEYFFIKIFYRCGRHGLQNSKVIYQVQTSMACNKFVQKI